MNHCVEFHADHFAARCALAAEAVLEDDFDYYPDCFAVT
jgi:hypothetical protein